MAEIINFNKARKRRDRAQAAQQAAENRVRFGRSKGEKAKEEAEVDAAEQKLDQLKREPPPEGA